ncbi:MAG: PKD domain-containing protein [Bacteroidetes bacterium]|nr:PKD domain-containing protein [Bacteroidota bacterium]
MKGQNYYIITFIILLFVSCKKKEYPVSSVEGAPVFNCSMKVNGNPTTFEAGVNNYYMYSSFQQDSNNVYGFVAGLKQANCSNCPNSIQIKINDFKVSALNANSLIDSALIPGNYNYLASNAASYFTAQFQSSYNKPVASYLWNFGDGATSSTFNPSHVYKKAGNYKVSLTVNGQNSCVSDVNSFQNIGFLNSGFRTTIIDSGGFGNTVRFVANNAQGTPPYSYFWNFGDGTAISTSAAPIHNYTYVGSYPVTLKVVDGTGAIAYAHYNVVTQSDVSSCAANYTIASVNLTPNTLGLSNIIINWTDANGTVYTSKNPLQPASSYFTIVSVNDYQKNDSNQLTKKLHIKFSCTVYNGTSSIVLTNADAIVCVAYK